ncbi:MAG: hypothetical protein JW891_05355 [Candidatus Lokiarchaeota archaeon]|nr:hypothetical protein [Candidatus Lokiarchaeota archaeon]
MIELENHFLENLRHQIKLKELSNFKRSLPTFSEQLSECDKAVRDIKEKFDEIRKRDAYKRVIGQINKVSEDF